MDDEKDPTGHDEPDGQQEEGDFDDDDFEAADGAWANIARRRAEGGEPEMDEFDREWMERTRPRGGHPGGDDDEGEPPVG